MTSASASIWFRLQVRQDIRVIHSATGGNVRLRMVQSVNPSQKGGKRAHVIHSWKIGG
jgi:hypothetical protein